MPDAAMLLKFLRVLLEYGMLIWLLVFVGRISKCLFLDMKKKISEQKKPELQNDEAVLAILGSEAGEEDLKSFEQIYIVACGSAWHVGMVAQYVIEDLGSRNHTYVNDQLLTGKAYIKPGDLIRIGLVTMRFER